VSARVKREHGSGGGSGWLPAIYLAAPIAWLVAFFFAPMVILFVVSFQKADVFTGIGSFTGWSNYTAFFSDHAQLRVLASTAIITTASMALMLALSLPIAYLLAFRVGRWELPLLLLLVVADELNPLIRVYAWRMLLGRDGILNSFFQLVGLVQHPIAILLFSKFAVVLVMSMEFLTYTMIPIYAALKTVDPSLLEAANDLGSRFPVTLRKVLIPLAAPGIFVAIILVGIPMLTEFVTPALVGGTSAYMIGNSIEDQILESGNWGVGAAMSFLMLVISAVLALVAYRVGKLNRLETAT
jgi:ABC-type spermidine/putrescine transport system permease subunit I